MKFISLDARERKCPFCKAVVLQDDAQRSLHHEVPECKPWKAAMRGLGAKRSITIQHNPGKA